MRIGLFTDAYLPDINGVVSSVVTLKKALEELGHTVFVISNHKSSKISLEDHVLRLPGLELKKFYGYKMSSPFQFEAFEYVRNMDLDVVHVQTEFGVGMFARQCAKNFNIPLVYTYHTTYEDYTHYINPMDLETVEHMGKLAIRSLSKILGNGAQAVIAPSEKTRNTLISYGVNTPIYVVPTGLDLSSFDRNNLDAKKVKEIRSSLGLTEEDHVVVFVGRIAKEKSIDIPIRAVAKSKDEHLHLVIVGGGPDEGYYKEIVDEQNCNDRVHFVGRVPKEKIPYYYAAFDCFVSASMTETQGMTYIEALASGLCVFGRRDEVLNDLVFEDKTGYYFDDENELVEKFDLFFSKSKEQREMMVNECIAKTEPFDTELFAHKALAVYEQAIDDFSQAFVVEKIKMVDDYVRLTVQRDSDREPIKFLIPLDDFFDLKISVNTILDAYLVENYLELQDFYKALKMAQTRALSVDCTAHEIEEYCSRKLDVSSEDAQTIVQELEQKGLINDRQYAMEKAQVWHSYGQNSAQIRNKLYKAGVDKDLIEEAISTLEETTEIKNAYAVAKRLVHNLKEQSNRMKRQTLTNKLVTKGYSLDVAKQVSESFEFDEDDSKSLELTIKKARRLYASFEEPKRSNKIRIYCLRKGYTSSQIDEILEGELVENQ